MALFSLRNDLPTDSASSREPIAKGEVPSFDLIDGPNPFAIPEVARTVPLRRFLRATRFLVAILLITVAFLLFTAMGKQWLLARLTSDFDTLPTQAKQERLIQIASFGLDSIEPLTNSLFDENDAVSEAAFALLRKGQNEWTMLPSEKTAAAHSRLVHSIAVNLNRSAPARAMDRAEWTPRQIARTRELLRQTMLEFSERDSNAAQKLLQSCTATYEQLNQTGVSNHPGKSTYPGKPTYPGKLVQPKPHVVTSRKQLSSSSQWTDWPPPSNSSPATESTPESRILRSGPRASTATTAKVVSNRTANPSNRLLALPDGTTAPLEPAPASQRAIASRPPQIHPQVGTPSSNFSHDLQPANHLADSPLAAMDDESLLRHLGNPDETVKAQARVELQLRGFSPSQLEFATALATAHPRDRMLLIDSLVRSGQFESGPWLSMLLDDPDRNVRLHVVSVLATSRNQAVQHTLRDRLGRERDVQVATRIRKVLQLR